MMKVICKINNFNSITDNDSLSRLKNYIFQPNGEVNLDIGRQYTVYGVLFRDNTPWYYLCDEDDDEYPTLFAAEFFAVVDRRLSKYWKLSYYNLNNGKSSTMLAFDEWANDYTFYERLINEEEDVVAIFSHYRKLIENE